MFYAFVRAVVGFALRLFYRVEVNARPLPETGPVVFVGNHPNSLVDPALVFVITARPVTFLAKAPLFKMPVIGWILKGLHALPVFRKQDDPTQMGRNEGTFEAATEALVSGRAITLFPEGRSHSEPELGEIKTGAARIAFRAAKKGAPPLIVPVGLTYEQKHRFRSRVLIEVGEPIRVESFAPSSEAEEPESVRRLTETIERGLRGITLNLAQWEDLPLVEVSEKLYAFRVGDKAKDPDRQRRFATGVQIFRAEQPERFAVLRDDLMSFKHRMDLVHADPEDLTILYRRSEVYRFIGRNLASLFLGFPLFLLGMVLFAVPFWLPRLLNRALKLELDMQATVKLVSALVLAPIWTALLTVLAWRFIDPAVGIVVLVWCLPLAVLTRYFLERWRAVLHDVMVFLTLGNRARLKARLLVEGERLATEVERLADEYGERVDPGVKPARASTGST